jgi:hypothetical protein
MMPNITDIIDYESGEMDQEDMAEFFQGMINSGVVWQLQGHYGRTAMVLIEAGVCMTAADFGAAQAVAEEDARETALANGQFGVGA